MLEAGGGRLDPSLFKQPSGRWPANLIHDGSEEVVGLFPHGASPWIGNPNKGAKGGKMFGGSEQRADHKPEYRNAGSAARFFYCAKASKKDRDEGLESFEFKPSYMVENGSKTAAASNGIRYERGTVQRNNHPTVKPYSLMAYLVNLITPPGGVVLDPFMGSGSTGKAAILEGFNFIGIELDPEYVKIAETRIRYATEQALESKASEITF
jgi:site-specific DNA-methyltransferase (adenine-specific)